MQDMTNVGMAAAGFGAAEDLPRVQPRISFIVQDMDTLGRSCGGLKALDFQIVDDSCDFHRPLASSLGREPRATAIRQPARPDPQSRRDNTTSKPVMSNASSPGAQNKRSSRTNRLFDASLTDYRCRNSMEFSSARSVDARGNASIERRS